jgi:hypothetical protein
MDRWNDLLLNSRKPADTMAGTQISEGNRREVRGTRRFRGAWHTDIRARQEFLLAIVAVF